MPLRDGRGVRLWLKRPKRTQPSLACVDGYGIYYAADAGVDLKDAAALVRQAAAKLKKFPGEISPFNFGSILRSHPEICLSATKAEAK